jgi:hypothetical protein
LFGALLFSVLLLFLPGVASASCCNSYTDSCCNIFGCNCDGACTNFGCNGPPVQVGSCCGVISGWDTCTADGQNCAYCTSPAYACNNCANCCSPSGATATLAPTKAATPPHFLISPPEVAVASPLERFKAVDTNGDGRISFEEARNWVRKHAGGAKMSDKELRSAFNSLDKNKNGTIEPEEFDASLAKGAAKPKP